MTEQAVQSYAGLVERARRLVERHVPAGSTVAVVSRGDPALLDLGDRTGWHVPSSVDGRYLGYPPADGPDAIRAVESVRDRGADFLLVPDTSSWWLSHYDGLRDHLERLGPPLALEPGAATLFALSSPAVDADEAERSRAGEDLAEIAGLLLPAGASVLVIGADATLGARLAPFEVTSLAPDAVAPGMLGSTSFVVIPCWHYDWLAQRADVREALTDKGRLVTWQQHVGALYQMAPSAKEASA